jgi:hypothetical protein
MLKDAFGKYARIVCLSISGILTLHDEEVEQVETSLKYNVSSFKLLSLALQTIACRGVSVQSQPLHNKTVSEMNILISRAISFNQVRHVKES